MNLLMVRHGEIPSNINKVYAGRSSETLTKRGLLQARDAAAKLEGREISTIYSSPIQRALQTAQIVGERLGIDPVTKDAFRELEMGPWEGMSENNIAKQYPNEWELWHARPAELKIAGRESLAELLQRVLSGVRDIYNKDGGRNIVIVSHVAVIRVLLLWYEKKSLDLYKSIHVQNAEIFEINITDTPNLALIR